MSENFKDVENFYRISETECDRIIVYSKSNNKCGVVDKNFKLVVPPIYDQIYSFEHDNRARFHNNKKYGIINANGGVVVKPKYDYIYPFDLNYAVVKLDTKFGLIDADGKEMLEPIYDEVSVDNKGNVSVVLHGHHGVMTKYREVKWHNPNIKGIEL